jgi:uncharacterized membrane protein YkvI
MKKKDNILKIAGVYATVIIGAGFASGQELMQFFANFGIWGVAGIIVSGFLFALVGWAVLEICQGKGFGYQELIQFCMGEKLGIVVEVAAAFFMYVLYVTMIAGAGAAINQVFGIEFSVAAASAALAFFIAMMFDLEGLMAINSKLAPVLAAGGLMIGLLTLMQQSQPTMAYAGKSNWLISSVVYSSYNMVTAISVLSAIGMTMKNRSSCRNAGLLGGGLMTLLGLFMLYPLYIYYKQASVAEVPLLVIAHRFSLGFEYFYLLMILCAIFTTSLSNGFALTNWAKERLNANSFAAKIILTISAFAASHIGFSRFVSRVYPIFSIIGLFEIIAIFIAWRKFRKAKSAAL